MKIPTIICPVHQVTEGAVVALSMASTGKEESEDETAGPGENKLEAVPPLQYSNSLCES